MLMDVLLMVVSVSYGCSSWSWFGGGGVECGGGWRVDGADILVVEIIWREISLMLLGK